MARKQKKQIETDSEKEEIESDADIADMLDDEINQLDEKTLEQHIEVVKEQIAELEEELGDNANENGYNQFPEHCSELIFSEDYELEAFTVPEYCIPIRADVRSFAFDVGLFRLRYVYHSPEIGKRNSVRCNRNGPTMATCFFRPNKRSRPKMYLTRFFNHF
jgi:hypothetical protein